MLLLYLDGVQDQGSAGIGFTWLSVHPTPVVITVGDVVPLSCAQLSTMGQGLAKELWEGTPVSLLWVKYHSSFLADSYSLAPLLGPVCLGRPHQELACPWQCSSQGDRDTQTTSRWRLLEGPAGDHTEHAGGIIYLM